MKVLPVWLPRLLVLAAAAGAVAYGVRRPPPPPAVQDEVCIVAPATPYDPASGQDRLAPRSIPAEARCPVCGMFPARTGAWSAQVIFANGDAQFFDSPLTLLLYRRDPGRYSPGRTAADIARIYVHDFSGGGWLPLADAYLVADSDALGPMRAGNFPAFASPAAARAFVAQHGGQVLGADAITANQLEALHQTRRHAHTSP